MKKIIIAIAMLLTMGVQAQSQQKYQINGNNIVAVSQAKQKKEAQKTSYTYTIKGKTYEHGCKGQLLHHPYISQNRQGLQILPTKGCTTDAQGTEQQIKYGKCLGREE